MKTRDTSFTGSASVVLLAIATVATFATLALSGCGADDSTSNARPSSSSTGMTAANGDMQQRAAAMSATPILNPSSTIVANPVTASASSAAASDPIVENMQASLAADNQQVAPVMRYAPGDSATSN
nr:hypothetical protein HUO10_004204 [Paraburkholderia busanensis]